MVSAFRPHRARPGGARASAPATAAPRVSPPPGSPRWSAGFCTSSGCSQRFAPTGLAPVERRLLHQQGLVPAFRPHRARPGGARASAPAGRFPARPFLVPKPPLHRDKLGGGGQRSVFPLWCRNPRSTETSSVGAESALRFPSGAETPAPPRQARWGRRTLHVSPLVQKPPLHRDKLGGGSAQSGLERFTDELRTPDACGLVRSSRLLRVASQGLSSALKGRSSIARGVNPGNARLVSS